MSRLIPLLIFCIGFPITAAAQPTATNDPFAQQKIAADQAQQQGDYAKSIELTSQVLQQKPDDHVAFYLRASARVESGRAQGNAKTIRAGVGDARAGPVDARATRAASKKKGPQQHRPNPFHRELKAAEAKREEAAQASRDLFRSLRVHQLDGLTHNGATGQPNPSSP